VLTSICDLCWTQRERERAAPVGKELLSEPLTGR